LLVKYPPNWQLKKLLRQKCTLRKKTIISTNDEYEGGVESFLEYDVDNCEIQPVTSEDLVWLPLGTLNIGDARAWFNELISRVICKSDFEISTLYDFLSAKIVVEDGEAKLKSPYPTDNPTISRIAGCIFKVPVFLFEVEETKSSGTEIKYILSKDNGSTWYYYSLETKVWKISDGTYTQSNTASEIQDNLSVLPFSTGTFRWKAFLHSTGSNTPVLKKVSMTFGLKIEVDDQIIDHENKRYSVEQIVDYYTKDSILLKEVYLKKVVGQSGVDP